MQFLVSVHFNALLSSFLLLITHINLSAHFLQWMNGFPKQKEQGHNSNRATLVELCIEHHPYMAGVMPIMNLPICNAELISWDMVA